MWHYLLSYKPIKYYLGKDLAGWSVFKVIINIFFELSTDSVLNDNYIPVFTVQYIP